MFTTSINQFGFWYAFTISIVNVAFFALFAYFDFLILFPRYAKDRRIGLHVLSLAIAAIILTPIKTAALIFTSTGNTSLQIILKDDVFFIFISTFMVGVGTTLFCIVMEWMVEKHTRVDLESKTLQTELKLLKSQINPHFLFNTLNSLYAHTLKKSDEAPEIVLKLSEMMRYMLYDCNEKEVFLEKEITYIQNYLNLESLRHGDRIKITFDIYGDVGEQKIAPLILMPFIENAFKHGTNSQIKDAYVFLKLDVQKDDIHFKMENSKTPSIPKSTLIKSGGIGLANVKRRMEILYPERYKLHIEESPNTYNISLHLNLKNIKS